MGSKIISQLDAQGVFVQAVHADESPLEPGVYLVPGGAVDAPPPDVPHGQRARWVADGLGGGAFVLEALPPAVVLPEWVPPTPAQLQADALRQVDGDVDAIYGAVVGNRAAEYEQAEREAQAWVDAGHVGAAPGSVASWAAAAGMTEPAAAADILAQAAAWRGAMAQIRAQRLAAKAAVRAGTVGAAMAAWNAFVVAMRLQLGV